MTSQKRPEDRVEGIRRAPRREAYENLPLSLIRDRTISYRALGVLTRLLSNADNFRMPSTALAQERKEGREAVRAALRELEAAGYISRERKPNSRGQWSTVMVVSDTPYAFDTPAEGAKSVDSRASASRASGNRTPVSRAVKNINTNKHHQKKTTTTEQKPLVLPRSLPDGDGRAAAAMVEQLVPDQALQQQLLDELDGANSASRIKGPWPNYFHGLIAKANSGGFVPAAGKAIAEQRQPQPSIRQKIGLPPREKLASRERVEEAMRSLGLHREDSV